MGIMRNKSLIETRHSNNLRMN